MSIWTITSMNLPSASTAADPEHVATCSIASCSRQCRLIRSPTEISRAGKRTQTTTYSGYESEMDSHFVVFEREAGIVHDRAKVIAMKMADAIHPLFAFEAVDAAKGELVAEPRPELDGAAVAAWAVLATVWP